jgi:NADPH2:quinone reductase
LFDIRRTSKKGYAMRAVVMTEPSPGPDRTEVREVPVPRPGAGQVSIDVSAAGINFIDVMARRGDPGYATSWPYVPGLEVAGTVREVGADVAGVSVGQRVAAFTPGGGLAEIALARADLLAPVAEGVPLPVAAAAPLMLSTALLLLTDVAHLQPGESVLMQSASGGVGSAVAQLVPVLGGGLRIGTVSTTGKVPDAQHSGWDVAFVRDDHLTEATRAVVAGGIDVILDPLGTTMLDLDLAIAAPGARIVLFGNAGGGQPEPLPPLGRLIGGNLAIAGFSISRLAATAPQRVAAALRRVLEFLGDGSLHVPITELESLDDVAATHQLLADRRGHGKYVVLVPPHN